MLFNSYPFIFIFLPITFLGARILSLVSQRYVVWWLVIASLFFYAYWNPPFVTLLLGSAIFNYLMAQFIERALVNHYDQRKRYLLIFAVIINLAILAYFKYTNFFLESVYTAFGMHFSSLDIILPLGISFFTFTQLAFLVDTSQGMTTERSFSNYLLFVTFFPHLIAGPLIHHKQMMPQFADAKNFHFNTTNISLGITIFVLGLAKKIFIADYLGEVADPVFAAAQTGQHIQFFEAWTGILGYTLQLYFDFSAYSEMAIGLSLLFNIRMPLNFNSPCKSESIIDFWQRWHMTLTRYIGEYLYNPIAMYFMRKEFRRSEFAQIIYTLIVPTLTTFVIAGLWHGANWTFLIFGSMHGVYLVINHLWRKYKKHKAWVFTSSSYKRLACLLTYLAVVFAFVFFRSDSVTTALQMIRAMIGMSGVSLPATIAHVLPGIDTIASTLSLTFNGIFPGNLFKQSHMHIFLLLLVGHAIVWGMPNLHQVMCRFSVTTQDMSEKAMKKREIPKGLFKNLIWNPTLLWAICIGVTFFAIAIALATIKSSAFLYYQF
jgi:D-alanyl-lipoteichoic acid acyltransferase DltB (MBOAT superfamily)